MARRQTDMRALNRRIVRSGAEFNAVMEQLIQGSAQEALGVSKGIMFDLYGELAAKVPKDTARTAMGFNVNEGPSEWVPPPGDYTDKLGQVMEENRRRLEAIPDGHIISISNNVEYLPDLEDGHSRQAPSGFIARAIQWATRRLEVAAERFNRQRF